MEIITFKDMSFKYPNNDKKALKHINFTINPGEFIVICGKSGCGKSTLLHHMKKELIPHGEGEGEVYYMGMPMDELDERTSAEEIGFVQQDPEDQVVTDKVWHELAFGLESLGYGTLEIRRKVAEMASFFGIQTWFRKSVFELSGGQKQLLNLASIMAMQPKILMLDEPTSQLDPIAASEFLDILRKINRELGTTIVLSEHRLEEVFPMADRVMVMEDGRVLIFDTVQEVGSFLSREKDNNSMFLGLPTSMKIYAQVNPVGPCPVTVRDGRTWLSNLLGEQIGFDRIEDRNVISTEKKSDIFQVIKLKDIWFRYEKDGEDIIRGLTMEVNKGELYCMVGGNGVGKTTTLKIIQGMLKPYRGNVIIKGKNIKKYNQNKLYINNLAVLPQNPQAIFSEESVEEELYDIFTYTNIPDMKIKDKVNDILF